MNRLYRLSAEYRVSAFLDDRLPATTAPIVETTDVQIRDMAQLLAQMRAEAEGFEAAPPALPPKSTAPGIGAVIVNAPAEPPRTLPAET